MEYEIDTEREAFGLIMPSDRPRRAVAKRSGAQKSDRVPLRQAVAMPGTSAFA